jgi:glycosyltransferase involved in cell wall biosynthesis
VHHVTTKPVVYGTAIARAVGVRAIVNAISGMGYAFGQPGLLRSTLAAGYRMSLRHPNMRVIFQNDSQREFFVHRKWLKHDQTIVIRGSGVDTEVFAPPLVRPTGSPLVCLVSRMLTTKGIPEFVEAARILRAENLDARFALVGESDPDNPDSIAEEQLRRWHAEGSIEYWGRRGDVAEILRGSAIACLPTYCPEGVPKSLIEAAASGLPIVTTDIPGCRELVLDGETGIRIPIKQVGPLVVALRTLLRDPELRMRMGARGRARVLAHYSLAYVVEAHLRVYADLLG